MIFQFWSFPMITEHWTKKLLLMKFEVLGLVNSFLPIQFSQLLLGIICHRSKNIISPFVISFAHQVEFYWLTLFLTFWPSIYSTLNKQCLETWSGVCLLCIWFIFVFLLDLKHFKKCQGTRGGKQAILCRHQWVKIDFLMHGIKILLVQPNVSLIKLAFSSSHRGIVLVLLTIAFSLDEQQEFG